MKARALNYIIFTGCAALTAIILDNDNTLTKQLGSLPPWAAELNQNIDAQVIGKIIKIIEKRRKELTLYIQVDKYLTKGKGNENTRPNSLELKIYNQAHKELINSYARNTSIDSNRSYLISFKEKHIDDIKYLELVTIDPYEAD